MTYIEIEKTHEYFRVAAESATVITKGPKANFETFFEVYLHIEIVSLIDRFATGCREAINSKKIFRRSQRHEVLIDDPT